jgi:glutathione S-transferase
MPTVYGVPPSPFVRKVRATLAEKGIDYELEMVSPFAKEPEYLKISPLGKVPAFRDGDFAFSDSSVICAYLEKTHPVPALYPDDAKDYARALWLEEYADSRLAEVVGAVFFNRVVKPKLMKQAGDEAAVKQALEQDLPRELDYLAAQLGDREYLVADRLTIADLSVATQLTNLLHAGESVDAARWPKLAAYVERLQARPSFASSIEQEKAMFASM